MTTTCHAEGSVVRQNQVGILGWILVFVYNCKDVTFQPYADRITSA